MKQNIVVKQKDARDCGACCLLSIIKYYDGFIPLEKIKLDTNTSINGTTAYHILYAANKYGLDGKGIKTNIDELKNNSKLYPLIAHVTTKYNTPHFIVIIKILKDKLIVMDPSKGIIKLNIDEFEKMWDGIVLLLKPRTKIEKYETKSIKDYIFSIISDDKKILTKVLILNIIITILSITIGFQMKFLLAIGDIQNKKLLYLSLAFVLFVNLICIEVEYYRSKLQIEINNKIDLKSLIQFLSHLFRLPFKVIYNKPSGEIMTRINELNHIKYFFTEIILAVVIDATLAISSLYILFVINKKLFFVLCLTILIYLIICLIINPIVYYKINDNIDYETDYNSYIVEKINSLCTIKNLNIIDYIKNGIESKIHSYYSNSYKLNKFINLYNYFQRIIIEIGQYLITAIGIIEIYNGNIELIDLITFITVMNYCLTPIKNITNTLPQYNLIKLSLMKIFEFYQMEEEVDKKEEFVMGDITLNNIDYSYDNYKKVIKNLNIKIKEKEHVFISGKSGVGKSTICNLLMKNNNNYNGIIKIGNIDIKNYATNTIRDNITYVSQNEVLFTDTIINNLLLNKEINPKDLDNILEICEIKEIIEKKPLGLDTLLIDGGANISGGEKQRIILARALIQNKKILLLDEALSESDSKREIRIVKKLRKAYKDKTIIYVAHRDISDMFDKKIEIGA